MEILGSLLMFCIFCFTIIPLMTYLSNKKYKNWIIIDLIIFKLLKK